MDRQNTRSNSSSEDIRSANVVADSNRESIGIAIDDFPENGGLQVEERRVSFPESWLT